MLNYTWHAKKLDHYAKKKKKVSVMYRKNMEAVMVKKSRSIEKFLERDISLP